MERIKKLIYPLLFVLAFASCKNTNEINFDLKNDPLFFSFTPLKIRQNNLEIDLNGYVKDFNGIDSVTFDGGEYNYIKNKHILTITESFEDIDALSVINFFKGQSKYSLICIKQSKIITEIEFKPESSEDPDSVKIAGDFNSWNPDNTIMTNQDGVWKCKLELNQGLYQYQIIVNNKWQNNYPNYDTVANGIGGYNTLLTVNNECSTIGFTLKTLSFTDEEICISASQIPEKLYILWENQIIPVDLEGFNNNEYTFKIPEEAKTVDRSHIRIYASYKNCISNNLLIPLQKGKVITSNASLKRTDKHSNIIYFMLVDRFKDGDTSINSKLNDPRVAEKANYYGGDLEGINQCIDNKYFEDLGVNTLWISPISQNPEEAYQEFPEPRRFFSGYHGYWPISSFDIDYRLGNKNTFKNLIKNAHNKDMNIILDFVANHVHEKNPLYQDNPDWATDLHLEDGRTNIRLWDECRLTTWFDTFLPSWDFETKEVTDTISEIALWWLKEYELDGFRHDATKHIPELFWKTLTKKIRTEYPNSSFYQIGETFGSRELIDSYIATDMLDGQFDFNLYFDARSCFADSIGDMQKLEKSLFATLDIYGYHNLMGNITGNHDLTRFITYADGSINQGEDPKEAGWNRNIIVENPESYKKLQNLTAFIMSIPGIPCVYYGDEIGMPGAGDPDNRRPMKFNNLNEYESQTLEIFKKLTNLRQTHIELIYGNINILEAYNGVMVIERQYFNNWSYTFINQTNKKKEIIISKNRLQELNKFNSHFGSQVNELSENFQIILEPYSFDILTNK